MDEGFSYTVDAKKILEYMKLPVEEKLNWLEEINEFTFLFLGEKKREIREKLRRGEI